LGLTQRNRIATARELGLEGIDRIEARLEPLPKWTDPELAEVLEPGLSAALMRTVWLAPQRHVRKRARWWGDKRRHAQTARNGGWDPYLFSSSSVRQTALFSW
jgi:hypothetical protein